MSVDDVMASATPVTGKGSAVQAVLTFIQDGLRNGSLPSSAQLPTEGEIAAAVGVSRTPVREAIKALEAVGVVEIRRGIGTFMRPQAAGALGQLLVFQSHLRATTPAELMETRLMVERTAAELAARNRTEADLARLQEVNATLRRKSADPAAPLDDLLAADLAFHHTVYDICGNHLVASLGRFVTTEASPWIRESLRRGGGERAARNHDLVIGMIEARNQNGAREAVSDRAVADGLKDFQLTLDTSTTVAPPVAPPVATLGEDQATRPGRRPPRTRQRLPLT
ncbi:hypothetical protein N825_12440 [Skermanella stibiiresistens SB22]|uniref:HTH gntR-type domain-containing protein n=1 Tax=Skermanella stibiiresistens SB22 TaxID=1385369 RepID=W9H4F8_9PROT|nr:FCD domain-containing protein [Skermanella stibiiresistens]EWY38613.1 hypothetical protein N825_12440 [Skermanella stibiiresistens SB22]